MRSVAVIGGGPAGLRAAECLAGTPGLRVRLFDAKPSVGRKFLVAGRGGLNITHSEPLGSFVTRYSGPAELWTRMLQDFDNQAMRQWLSGLGFDSFIGTSGRIFPRPEGGATVLRAWLHRLRTQGVLFHMRHRWCGLERQDSLWNLSFETPEGPRHESVDAVLLALGGGSWPQTGSDARWIPLLESHGVAVVPLQPANCGWEVEWPETFLCKAEGLPLKNISVHAGDRQRAGELVITRHGLEGGPIYALGPVLRGMSLAEIHLDLKPSLTEETLVRKIGTGVLPADLFNRARKVWNLPPATEALLESRDARSLPLPGLVALVKRFPLPLKGPRPLAEAISSAGGVRWTELDSDLMLTKCPGIYLAGEMIDWEAPTGGYLLQGCFATATYAAKSLKKIFLQ